MTKQEPTPPPDTTTKFSTDDIRAWIAKNTDQVGVVARILMHALCDRIDELAAPVELILFCPMCHARHIDRELANKPHKEHACQTCGFCWKPSRRPTVGVAFLQGYKDEPAHSVEQLGQPATYLTNPDIDLVELGPGSSNTPHKLYPHKEDGGWRLVCVDCPARGTRLYQDLEVANQYAAKIMGQKT